MRDREDLRPFRVIDLAYHRVRESIEVVSAQAEFTERPSILILDQRVSHPFEFAVLCDGSGTWGDSQGRWHVAITVTVRPDWNGYRRLEGPHHHSQP